MLSARRGGLRQRRLCRGAGAARSEAAAGRTCSNVGLRLSPCSKRGSRGAGPWLQPVLTNCQLTRRSCSRRSAWPSLPGHSCSRVWDTSLLLRRVAVSPPAVSQAEGDAIRFSRALPMSPSRTQDAWGSWPCPRRGVRQAGRAPGGEAGSRTSAPCFPLSVFFSGLKTCISKEINFKVLSMPCKVCCMLQPLREWTAPPPPSDPLSHLTPNSSLTCR